MSSGRPGASNRCASPSRAPKTIATRSARSLLAANTSASADGWSNHCASSTKQRTGRSSAAAASKPSTRGGDEEPVSAGGRRRVRAPRPAQRIASPARPRGAQDRAHQAEQTGERQVRLGLHTGRAQHRHRGSALGGVLEQRGLADPRLAAHDQRLTLAARRRARSSRSISAHSRSRPTSAVPVTRPRQVHRRGIVEPRAKSTRQPATGGMTGDLADASSRAVAIVAVPNPHRIRTKGRSMTAPPHSAFSGERSPSPAWRRRC